MDAAVHDSQLHHSSDTHQTPPHLHHPATSPLLVPHARVNQGLGEEDEEALSSHRDPRRSSSFPSAKSADDTEHESDASHIPDWQSARSSTTTLDVHIMSRLPPQPSQTGPHPPPPLRPPPPHSVGTLSRSSPETFNNPPLRPPFRPLTHINPSRPSTVPPPRRPPPPPAPGQDHDTPRPSQAMAQGLPLQQPLSRSSIDTAPGTAEDAAIQAPNFGSALPKTIVQSPESRRARAFAGRGRYSRRRVARRRKHSEQSDSEPASESSTSTAPRLIDDVTSLSGSWSEEDPIVLRSSRQFPPLLPTAPAFTTQLRSHKTSMTNHITSWVSEYEKNRISRRRSGTDMRASILLEPPDAGQSHVSRASSSEEDEVELLWTKLKRKRATLNDIKTQMSKQRKKLRQLRRKRDDADNSFMSVIRPMLVAQHGSLGTSQESLERRVADMQRLRTEYQALEGDYEELEVKLDEEEDELNTLETRFFSLLAVGHARALKPSSKVQPAHDKDKYTKDMPNDLKGISRDGPPDDLHPLYVELMSTVGEFENAKEELEELLFVNEQHKGEMKMKKAAGMELSEYEIEFFTEFPSDEQQMRSTVARLEAEVARLRQLCEEKGVMRKHLSARVAYLLYPEKGYEDLDLDLDLDMDLDDESVIREHQSALAHPKFPVLLSQPEHVLPEKGLPQTPRGALTAAAKLPETDPAKPRRMQLASKEYAIDRLVVEYEEGGKGDFINRWLLHQLRRSSMSVLLLYKTFVNSQALKIRDLWRWQSDVLHYWWRDDTANFRSYNSMKLENSNNHGSRIGTPQLSRAATQAAEVPHNALSQIASSSVAAQSASM